MATATAAAPQQVPPLEEGSVPTGPSAPDIWTRLREPFDESRIGKLPRATIGREEYKKLQKGRCPECGGWHPLESTIHLDYVGHADVTDRLLTVDPTWDWEPLARDVNPDVLVAAIASGDAEIVRMVINSAPPKLERAENGSPVGMWMRLTVGGQSRIGYGSCEPGKNDAEKELIGDGLRNAGLRFGIALDLWRKERPHMQEGDDSSTQAAPPAGRSQSTKPGLCEQCAALGGKSKKGYPAKFWPNEHIGGFQCDGIVDGKYMNHQPAPPPGSAPATQSPPVAGVGTAPATQPGLPVDGSDPGPLQTTGAADALKLKLTVEALRKLPTGWPNRMAGRLAIDVDERFNAGITPSLLREMPEDKLKFIRDWAELLGEQAAKGADPWPAETYDPGDINPDDIPFN